MDVSIPRLETAERQAARKRAAALKRIAECPEHEVAIEGEVYCYPTYDNPTVLGGITYRQTCRCGASRMVASTGSEPREYDVWDLR